MISHKYTFTNNYSLFIIYNGGTTTSNLTHVDTFSHFYCYWPLGPPLPAPPGPPAPGGPPLKPPLPPPLGPPPLPPSIIAMTLRRWLAGFFLLKPPPSPAGPWPGTFFLLGMTVIYLPLNKLSLWSFAFIAASFDSNSMYANLYNI